MSMPNHTFALVKNKIKNKLRITVIEATTDIESVAWDKDPIILGDFNVVKSGPSMGYIMNELDIALKGDDDAPEQDQD